MTNVDFLYNKDVTAKIFGKNHFVDKKLHFRIIEHGTVLPHKYICVNGQWNWGFGGIVDSKNNFIKSSFVRYGDGAAYTPLEEVHQSPTTVIYLGLFDPVWGHVLTDNIRRLWFLKSDVFRGYFKNCPLVYVPYRGDNVEHHKNFCRLLEIMQIDLERLHPINQPVQFENIILPDESFLTRSEKRFFTNEYKETIEIIREFSLKNRTTVSNKKIYYFYGKYQIGEERLAEYFRSKGYEIISPEKLTFDEQLNLLINCESFVSTLGSCSHNSVLLRDGTQVILIPRSSTKFWEASSYQNLLDEVHDLNSTYINSSLSIFSKESGLSCFIISEQLKSFFGEEFDGYSEDDFKIFLAYVNYSINSGFKMNEDFLRYCTPMYQKFIEQLKQHEDLLKAYGVEFQ